MKWQWIATSAGCLFAWSLAYLLPMIEYHRVQNVQCACTHSLHVCNFTGIRARRAKFIEILVRRWRSEQHLGDFIDIGGSSILRISFVFCECCYCYGSCHRFHSLSPSRSLSLSRSVCSKYFINFKFQLDFVVQCRACAHARMNRTLFESEIAVYVSTVITISLSVIAVCSQYSLHCCIVLMLNVFSIYILGTKTTKIHSNTLLRRSTIQAISLHHFSANTNDMHSEFIKYHFHLY